MENYKKLFNDSLIFAIGNFGSKLITFLMLPLYTYALSTTEYGIVDLILTTISLLLPIVGLSIYESVLRFGMDKNYDNKTILSNGLMVTFISSIVILMTVPLIAIYYRQMLALPLLLIIQLFQNLFSQYAKAINKLKVFALNGILLSFLTALFNIIFLIPLNMGLSGYFISLLIANSLSTLYLVIRLNIIREFNIKSINWNIIRQQLRFSIPLIPNSIAWWLTTAVGRYFILLFLGASANGIYAVSTKIPTLLTVFTSIFSQSWQLSAIEGYEKKESRVVLSNVYNYYIFLLFIGSSILIFLIRPIMSIIVSQDFFEAWKYVPLLLVSVLFSSISGFLGSQYIAMRDTYGVFKTTLIGAIVNVFLNIFFLQFIGLQGVGLASAISFFVVWLIRHQRINSEYKLEFINSQFVSSILVLLIQSASAILNMYIYSTIIQILCMIGYIFIYRKNFKVMYSLIKVKIFRI